MKLNVAIIRVATGWPLILGGAVATIVVGVKLNDSAKSGQFEPALVAPLLIFIGALVAGTSLVLEGYSHPPQEVPAGHPRFVFPEQAQQDAAPMRRVASVSIPF